MVSKRWQRTQKLVAHLALTLGGAFPLFLIQTTVSWRSKVLVIGVGYLILVPLVRALHRRFANTFVKVVMCEYDVAARIVQRALNSQRLPFTKRTEQESIVFNIRQGQMDLTIDDFALNLPIDDHIRPKVATKLTLRPETAENAELMRNLRFMLDEAFEFQGI